jgi:hypothetical protein
VPDNAIYLLQERKQKNMDLTKETKGCSVSIAGN